MAITRNLVLLGRLICVCVAMALCVSCGIFDLSTQESRCRLIYPDVADNPELSGGYSFLAHGGSGELCLYGSLEAIDLRKLNADVGARQIDVTVNSTGGPVEIWLALAERLEGQVKSLTVDSLCMSSCANYLPVIAKRVTIPQGALMVWHGAGTTKDHLYHRTQALYRRNGVDMQILTDTGRQTDMGRFDGQGHVRQVIGYAVTPTYLRTCYGFKNLGSYWHPQTHEGVNAALQKRSPSSGVFVNPLGKCGSA